MNDTGYADEDSRKFEIEWIIYPLCTFLHLSLFYYAFVFRRVSSGNDELPYIVFQLIKLLLYDNLISILANSMLIVYIFVPDHPSILSSLPSVLHTMIIDRQTLFPGFLIFHSHLYHRFEEIREKPKGWIAHFIIMGILMITIISSSITWMFSEIYSIEYHHSVIEFRNESPFWAILSAAYYMFLFLLLCHLLYLIRHKKRSIALQYGISGQKKADMLKIEERVIYYLIIPFLGLFLLIFLLETAFFSLISSASMNRFSFHLTSPMIISDLLREAIPISLNTVRVSSLLFVPLCCKNLRREVIVNVNLFTPPPIKQRALTKVENLSDLKKEQEDIMKSLRQVGLFE